MRGACVGLIILLLSATTVASGEQAPGSSARVRVQSGALSGVVAGGIVSYKGIPYAAPPVGDLRWRPPVAPLPWTGVRVADDYGASCPQAQAPERVPFGSRAATTGEDCLTLNVWAPAAHATALPVMVWIHGGGNVNGTGSQRFFDGSAFARDGVVLVTLNYRLGLLGFFAHPALVREAAGGDFGNFGLLDQIAALRWVRANIAAFGGDPDNVTVFGESAGAEDIVVLAASDAAAGLFRRGIAESPGGLWDFPTLAQAQATSTQVAAKLGLAGPGVTAAQLRALPVDALTRVNEDDQVGPMVDGRVVSAPPWIALAHGARVPLVIGTNGDENGRFGADSNPSKVYPQLSPADVAFVRARDRARGLTTDTAVANELIGDGFFTLPSRWVAAHASAAAPAYLYRFDYVASFLAARRSGATHGSEIPFVFETFPAELLTDADRKTQAALHDCWLGFARTGVPACDGVRAWPAYDARNRRVMVFDAQPSVRDPGDTDVMDLLERKLFPG